MERACRLSNATFWEITPSLPLPSLPVSCGARSEKLLLSEDAAGGGPRSVDRNEILGNANRIADLLRDCDVSYLNIKKEGGAPIADFTACPQLYSEVLSYNSRAFEYASHGSTRHNDLTPERKPFELNGFSAVETQKISGEDVDNQLGRNIVKDSPVGTGSRKGRLKSKETASFAKAEEPDPQEIIRKCCESIDDFCGRADIAHHDQGMSTEGAYLSLNDIKFVLNEISTVREKKLLHLVPVAALTKLLNILDCQIKFGQGLPLDEVENLHTGEILDHTLYLMRMNGIESSIS